MRIDEDKHDPSPEIPSRDDQRCLPTKLEIGPPFNNKKGSMPGNAQQ